MNIFKRFFKLRKNTKCKHNIGFNKYKKYVACNKYHTLVNKNVISIVLILLMEIAK